MFSGPQDNFTPPRGGLNNPPPAPQGTAWITGYASVTPVTRYWGLVSDDEGAFGDFVATNWNRFIDEEGPLGVGGNDMVRRGVQTIFDGSTVFDGSQRLIFPSVPLATPGRNHWSTAVNFGGNLNPNEQSRALSRKRIWTQMFTAAQPE